MKTEYGLSKSFHERKLYIHFVSACIERFPLKFLKDELIDIFLTYSEDKVPAIKILYLETVKKLKPFCLLDEDFFNKVENSVAHLREDSSSQLWSKAETFSYEMLTWKRNQTGIPEDLVQMDERWMEFETHLI